MKRKTILFVVLLLALFVINSTAGAQEVMNAKMSYNGPADVETNAVHEFAVNFKEFVELGTNGRITITLYSDSQLGNEEQRMEQTMNGSTEINVASNAGMVSVYPEIYAATIPFMFDSFRAAHYFFDDSDYWNLTTEEFEEKTGVALLEAVEEGGFLAFTNNEKEIKSPADFEGIKFRGMDPGQVALYKSFGASGTPIPWTELYMALQTGVVSGQMNPPTYIISGSLYEVQDYMTMANIQYSCQWLTINADWLNSLSAEDRYVVEQAAHAANVRNRLSVEAKVAERVDFIEAQGVEVYYPNQSEMQQFKEIGQPDYIAWINEKIDQEYMDMALESAENANQEAN
jgi:TRAP-type C4-dicarboxylate transport system substrate-binding protein